MRTKNPRRSTARQEMELANKEILRSLRTVTHLFRQFPKTSKRPTAQIGKLYELAAIGLGQTADAAVLIAGKLNVR